MPIRPFFFCLLLPLCAPRLTAQTTPDAAIINAAMQMNLIDQYRNSLNLQGTQNTNSAVPDAFFDDIPFFSPSKIIRPFRACTMAKLGIAPPIKWATLGFVWAT
jgi:hypothetical protein